jgi:hypothetical protein
MYSHSGVLLTIQAHSRVLSTLYTPRNPQATIAHKNTTALLKPSADEMNAVLNRERLCCNPIDSTRLP